MTKEPNSYVGGIFGALSLWPLRIYSFSIVTNMLYRIRINEPDHSISGDWGCYCVLQYHSNRWKHISVPMFFDIELLHIPIIFRKYSHINAQILQCQKSVSKQADLLLFHYLVYHM
jgi:hypothetical protein